MPEPVKFGEKPCRWYWEIGAGVCDNCGRPARDHEGAVERAPGSTIFAGEWVGLTWAEERAAAERRGNVAAARALLRDLSDDDSITLAAVAFNVYSLPEVRALANERNRYRDALHNIVLLAARPDEHSLGRCGVIAATALDATKSWGVYEREDGETQRLRKGLEEAIVLVEDWAGYASDYFRQKHDLAGDVARLRAALKEAGDG